MEHMLLLPVIESKYSLRVKEDSHVNELQPAIVAQVISKMEAFDLVEYEFPITTIIDDNLTPLSQEINKIMTTGLQNSTIYGGKCTDFTYSCDFALQRQLDRDEFLAKRLSVSHIRDRLMKKTISDVVRFDEATDSKLLAYEELENIHAVL